MCALDLLECSCCVSSTHSCAKRTCMLPSVALNRTWHQLCRHILLERRFAERVQECDAALADVVWILVHFWAATSVM